MKDQFIEPLIELLLYAFSTGALAVIGGLAEQTGIHTLSAGGNVTLGLWFVGIGAVGLYASYQIATDKLIPQIHQVR